MIRPVVSVFSSTLYPSRIMKAFLALLLLGSLCGSLASCTATYEHRYVVEPTTRLDPSRSVAVVVPADGRYADKEYSGSGAQTAEAVTAAFAERASGARAVSVPAGGSASEAARQVSATYVAVPEILHWEDRATEWSGRRDVVTVKIGVYEVGRPAPIASVEITGKSKWMTFGGDHPQDLLPTPVREFVARLYGGK